MGNPPFNPYYLGKLTELCPSIQWNIWKSLTTGKYPITIEQASGIYPEIEKKIDREILNYKNRKQRQRVKRRSKYLSTSDISSCSSLSKIDSKKLDEYLDVSDKFEEFSFTEISFSSYCR
ncbi:10483_t:CDS:2 [Entrophospora sp. SA101]|nr:10483_t:CDS:2 [Entrophospora sp. SA101]